VTLDQQTTKQYVVTDGSVPPGQIVFTPAGFKNIAVEAITPFFLIIMRGVYSFGSAFIGLVLAGMGTNAVGHPVFMAESFKGLIVTSATLAAATTFVSVAKNMAAQWTALGDKYPILKA